MLNRLRQLTATPKTVGTNLPTKDLPELRNFLRELRDSSIDDLKRYNELNDAIANFTELVKDENEKAIRLFQRISGMNDQQTYRFIQDVKSSSIEVDGWEVKLEGRIFDLIRQLQLNPEDQKTQKLLASLYRYFFLEEEQ